jgi:tetratricopeptide (TPR) repeat protein
MAVDKNKIIAEATKAIQRGQYDRAIKEYEKILREDPRDVRALLKVAELFQKKGDDRLAAEAFRKVAETYADQGFFLKSVAVYKQIAKLLPEDVRVNERLAALYQQLGLMSDAMAQLQLMAAGYERAGEASRPQLLDVLKHMVDLDPENVASTVKLGEIHQRANQVREALEYYRRAADYLKKHNRADEYLKLAERIVALQPDDLRLVRELAHIYLAKGDAKRALAKLQQCYKADPQDVDTLGLLAQAFKDIGQVTKTVQVYKEVAKVHEAHGRAPEARAAWRRVLDLAPEDPDARRAAGVASPQAPSPPPRPTPAPPAGSPAAVHVPVPAVATAADRAPAAGELIPKLLTETDVYLKYGLLDKALDHLRKVLAEDPGEPRAHEKAREIHAAAGRHADAAVAAEAAVRAWAARGQLDPAREALARLRQLDPAHGALAELAGALGSTEEIRLDGGDLEEVHDEDLSPAADRELRVVPLAPETVELVQEAPPEEAPAEPLPEFPPLDADLPPLDEDALALGATAPEAEEVVEDEAPPPPLQLRPDPGSAAWEDDAALDAARASLEAEEEVVDEAPPPVVIPAPAEIPDLPAPAAAAAEEEADLGDELDEAAFLVSQGLLDDARESLESLATIFPGHSGVAEALAELARRAAVAAPSRPGAAGLGEARPSPVLVDSAAVEAGASFDIGRELAEELDPGEAPAEEFQYSAEDVFDQFKKGVAQHVKAEDSETHYDLGIAYREMGLLDDAVGEFETALRGANKRKEVDCLSAIAGCRLGQGRPADAMVALKRALGSDYLTREATKAVLFDLGVAHEAAGDREVALHYFQKVARGDAAFRDVRRRVEALGGGPGRPPPDDPQPPSNGAATRGQLAAPAGQAPPPAPPPGASGRKKNIGYL